MIAVLLILGVNIERSRASWTKDGCRLRIYLLVRKSGSNHQLLTINYMEIIIHQELEKTIKNGP